MSNKSEKDMLVSEPTRYTSGYYDYGNGASGPQMEPDAIGEYVTYLDYAMLRAERDELVGALEEIMRECDENHSAIAKARAYSIAREVLAKHKPE